MWSPGLYAGEQAELANSPPHCNLTVKDLLLSGSGGDLVSSPYPTPGTSEVGGHWSSWGAPIPPFWRLEDSHRQGMIVVQGKSKSLTLTYTQSKSVGPSPEFSVSWAGILSTIVVVLKKKKKGLKLTKHLL